MAKRTAQYRSIEQSRFIVDDQLRAWTKEHFPTIDVDATYELFKDKALAAAWAYADWRAAWRNYLRNSKQYGGVVYVGGLEDPAFHMLIVEARTLGFRDPRRLETAASYRTALRAWRDSGSQDAAVRQRVLSVIRRIP
jgi:hypothetical protein